MTPFPPSRALAVLIVAALIVPPIASGGAARGTDPLDTSAIDRYVEAVLANEGLPGLALAVVQGDETAYARGYGRADPTGRPVTPDTPFMIASVTKTITAVAILQLLEEGRLALDDPVARHLPWFRVADEDASREMTIAQLLSHTSGLPAVTPGSFERVLGRPQGNDLEREVRLLADVGLAFPPGEGFLYSNAGFGILALLIETASGLSYEEYVEQRVYAPLDMRHAHTRRESAADDGAATGHRYRFGHVVPYAWDHTRAHLGAGFTYASASDLAKYATALLHGGALGDARILSAQSVALMHEPRATQPGQPDKGYGLGWHTGELHGRRMVQHGGVAPDMLAHVILLPDDGIGVVVLMNANDGLHSARFAHVGPSIASIALGEAPPAAQQGGDLILLAFRAIVVLDAILLAAIIIPPIVRRLRGKRAPASRVGPLALAVLGGTWAYACLHGLPAISGISFAYLAFMVPDLHVALLAGGAVGILAVMVGTGTAGRRTFASSRAAHG